MTDVNAVPTVVPYDDSWPAWFERESRAILALTARWATTQVEHVGSTSIVGMPAKPVLDLMLGVRDPGAAAEAAERLRRHGWQRRPHRVDAELVVRAEHGLDAVHLHLSEVDSQLWRERLAFRDALRADPALVDEYARLKRRLLDGNRGQMYAAADKQEFVGGVLAASGIRLDPGRHGAP